MRIRILPSLFILSFIMITMGSSLLAAPKITASILASLEKEVKKIEIWVTDPNLIAAVKKQSQAGLSLQLIKQRDLDWRAARKGEIAEPAFMKKTLNSDLAKWLKNKNRKARGQFPEIFLTDNQGANIALSRYTSDYWQGDEAKWQNAFKDGRGAVFYGEPKFDKSSKAMIVQVSVPVKSAGEAIGVIVVGVKFSKLK